MLKFKKKQKAPVFEFSNEQHEVLFCGVITDVPLTEAMILQKSIEFFDDPEPCYIHRGAVMTRLYHEIELMLTELLSEAKPVLVQQEIPTIIGQYLEIENIATIRYQIQMAGDK